MIKPLETALGEIGAGLRRSCARQAVRYARRLRIELGGARRKGRKLDVRRAGNRTARDLGGVAYVDEPGGRRALKQRLQSDGIERLIHWRPRFNVQVYQRIERRILVRSADVEQPGTTGIASKRPPQAITSAAPTVVAA